jgi:hypothetical protein
MYVKKILVALAVFVCVMTLVNYVGGMNDLVVADASEKCPGSTLVVELSPNGQVAMRCVSK